jgi:hypothetical protein
MWRRIQTVRGMIEGPSDVWLGIRMVAWSAALPALKHLLPLQLLTRLMWAKRRAAPRPDREPKVTYLARRIYRARPFLRRDNCLERSLLAYRYLAREGMEPHLVLGARKSEGRIHAHAWVTIGGRPVMDGHEALGQFTSLTEFGAGGSRLDGSPGVPEPSRTPPSTT